MIYQRMKYYSLFLFYIHLLSVPYTQCSARYKPDWDSLDSRPLPFWYDEAKIGIFIHWGVFSVPSFESAWFWERLNSGSLKYVDFMRKNFKSGFKYQNFASGFTAEFFNPDEWSDIFSAAGARYVVLTSKHHEGYTMWPSNYSWNWNSVDVGPRRNLVGELANSIKSKYPDIHFGIYHSLYEWFHPLYLKDKESSFATDHFVTEKTIPELYELVLNYHPEVIWSDGDWEADENYWKSKEFLAWLFSDSPVKDTVVVNDRWGKGVSCHHGSFYNCKDKYNPLVLQDHKWENCMTLDKEAWGYRRNAGILDYLSITEILKIMAETISCGGNILINVGPTHDGRIVPIMEERLRQLGSWLNINGEAIYRTKPWKHQNDSVTEGVWFTQDSSEKATYAIVLYWPSSDSLVLGSVTPTFSTKINIIGFSLPLKYKKYSQGIKIKFPPMSQVKSNWVWVLKMVDVQPVPRNFQSK